MRSFKKKTHIDLWRGQLIIQVHKHEKYIGNCLFPNFEADKKYYNSISSNCNSWSIMWFSTIYLKNINFYRLVLVRTSKYISILNIDWFNKFIKKLRKSLSRISLFYASNINGVQQFVLYYVISHIELPILFLLITFPTNMRQFVEKS